MPAQPTAFPQVKMLDEKCLIVFLLLLTLSLIGCSPQPLATEVVVTPFTVTEFVVTPSVVTAGWF